MFHGFGSWHLVLLIIHHWPHHIRTTHWVSTDGLAYLRLYMLCIILNMYTFFSKILKDNTFNSYQIFIITKLMYFLCLTFLLIKFSKVCIVSYMHGLWLTIGWFHMYVTLQLDVSPFLDPLVIRCKSISRPTFVQ